jgi:ankyrin repeat protein
MFEAARSGNSELLLSAVDAGLPANLTNSKGKRGYGMVRVNLMFDQGNTLLMLAAYAGHLDLTKGLLDRGADPNRENDLGQSIVAGAVFKTHDAVVKVLVEKGANPRSGVPTAIQTALMFGMRDVLDVLGATEEDKVAAIPKMPSMVPS